MSTPHTSDARKAERRRRTHARFEIVPRQVDTVWGVRRVLLIIALCIPGLALVACGSSGGSKSSSSDLGATPGAVLTVGANPSVSSKMICGEARPEIAESLGVAATQVTKPTWIDDVYSCTYVYPDGSFTLSVKEVNGLANAEKYFKAQKVALGVEPGAPTPELGQRAFVSKGGGLVVQKDNKVLTIDVSHLPAQFGPNQGSPEGVAEAVGGVIMGCWTGA